MKTYEYYINLDERGEFYSDVRDEDGESVAEFFDAVEFNEDGNGDIRNIFDVEEYVRFLGIIGSDDELVSGN